MDDRLRFCDQLDDIFLIVHPKTEMCSLLEKKREPIDERGASAAAEKKSGTAQATLKTLATAAEVLLLSSNATWHGYFGSRFITK